MNAKSFMAASLLTFSLASQIACAGLISPVAREVEEFGVKKLASTASKSLPEVTEQSARAVAKYGEEARPLVKATGSTGVNALEQAGPKAPEVIKLYARKGDEAVWVISENRRLAIFLKHGDSAADALIKHPGIADSLVSRFGANAAGALNSVSRQNAQRLLANEGVLSATPRSAELLLVIKKYGDPAMEFIWRNKGALVGVTVLAKFLNDPQPFIQGLKELVIDPVVKPIVGSVNWTLIFSVGLLIIFLPFVARSLVKARAAMKADR